MSLRERTVHGIAWTLVTRLVAQIVGYVVSVALARMLTPADFGLVGMVGVFTGFAAVFIDFGIGSAIVQRKEVSEDQLASAFWATVAMGAILSLMFFVGAPLVARFYHRPELIWLTRICAINFLLSSIGVVPRSLFVRALKIKRLMVFDLGISLSAGVVSLVLAASGAGVWTIVVSMLWMTAGQSLLPLVGGKWRPLWHARSSDLRPLLAVGLSLLGFSVINYWGRNFDNLIIGSRMGETELGIYSRGYALMLLPVSQIAATLGGSLLPALSRMHEDKERSGRVFLRILRLMAFAAFPAMIGLCVVADPFVRALYGAKWLGLIPVLRVLAVVGALQAITNPTGWLYISQGRTDRLFRWGLVSIPLIVLALFLGARAGSSFTVAVAYLIVNVILTLPCLSLAVRLVGVGLPQVFRAIWSPFAHTLTMASAVALVGRVLPVSTGASLRLMIQISTGAAAYSVSNILLRSAAFLDLKEELSGRFDKVRAGPAGAIENDR